jgi:hypothetical protein
VRAVLRADAILYALFGALLLASSWERLFDALDLPSPQPALWTQVAGALLLGLAYLLWISPRDVRLTHAVALVAMAANALAALIVLAWLLFGELAVGALGTALLSTIALTCAAFAVAEARIASRSVAMLMPQD